MGVKIQTGGDAVLYSGAVHNVSTQEGGAAAGLSMSGTVQFNDKLKLGLTFMAEGLSNQLGHRVLLTGSYPIVLSRSHMLELRGGTGVTQFLTGDDVYTANILLGTRLLFTSNYGKKGVATPFIGLEVFSNTPLTKAGPKDRLSFEYYMTVGINL